MQDAAEQRQSKCDVFVSFSRDMAEWAAAIEATIDAFCGTRGLALDVVNWRDIDPLDTTAVKSWQDLVGAPSDLGAKVCIVLIGERVGCPLPADFSRRQEIADRLAANGIDWVYVPGVHVEAQSGTRVPLTGLLFEFFDAFLPTGPGGALPDLHVILRGPAPNELLSPNFGGGQYYRSLSGIGDMQGRVRATQEYLAQIGWLETFYKGVGLDGKRPGFWIDSIEKLREHVRGLLAKRFGSVQQAVPQLPGLMPYGVEHADLFLGRGAERAYLLGRVFPERATTVAAPRRLLLLEGASGSGKSSLLRAGLLAAAHERYRRDEGWRVVFLSLAEIGRDETLLTALARAMAVALPSLAEAGLIAERLDSDPETAARKLVALLDTAARKLPAAPVPRLLIVIDQLEIAFDQLAAAADTASTERVFLDCLSALGTTAATGPLADATAALAAHMPVTIVAALPSDRLAEADSALRLGMGAHIHVSAALGDTAIREIIVGTLERLGIAVPAATSEIMVTEALEAARSGPIQPLVALALRSLQQRWEDASRPANGLTEEDIRKHGRLETAISRLGESAWQALATASARATPSGTPGETADGGMTLTVKPLITTIEPPALRPLMPGVKSIRQTSEGPLSAAMQSLLGLLFGASQGPQRPPSAPREQDHHSDHHHGGMPAMGARPINPQAGLDDLLLRLTRLERRGGTFRVALRSVGEGELSPDGRAVAAELLSHRLLWRVADGGLRLVHERVLLDWKPANSWLDRETDGLALLTRLEREAEERRQHIADGDATSADARLELGNSWPLALQLWAFRQHRLPAVVSAHIDAAIDRRIARAGEAWFRDALLWIACVGERAEAVGRLLASGAQVAPLSKEGRALADEIGAYWPLSWGNSLTALHVAALKGAPAIVRALLDRHSPVDAATDDGWCAIHFAAAVGYEAVLRLLADGGATLDLCKSDGLTALHLAALNGHADCASALLAAGASVNAKTEGRDWLPLHAAAKAGELACLDVLIAAGADLSAKDAFGWQAVHSAANAGHQHIVERLFAAGVPLEAEAGDGHTVLGRAIHSGSLALMQALLDQGADLYSLMPTGKSHLDCASEEGNLEVVRFLVERGLWISERLGGRHNTLIAACGRGHAEVARYLVALGANVETTGFNGTRPLHAAAYLGKTDVVHELLSMGADIHATDNGGATPLVGAACAGHPDVARILIEHGATTRGALHSAAHFGQCAVIELLLEHKAEIDFEPDGDQGLTPLRMAVEQNQVAAAALLIRRGAKVDFRNEGGFTPLHSAASMGHMELARLLVDAKAEVDPQGSSGDTPLLCAANSGHDAIVELLLAHGADPTVARADGWMPVHAAISNKHFGAVRLMLAHVADIDVAMADGHTLLGRAAHVGDVTLVRDLLARGADVTRFTTSGDTPLHCSSQDGHVDIVAALLDAGARIDAGNPTSGTALYRAVHYNRPAVVNLLLDRGADPFFRLATGETMLHAAATGNNAAVVAELTRRGVDVNAANAEGWTPAHTASFKDRLDCLAALLDAGAGTETRLLNGRTPLAVAVEENQTAVVRFLIDRGASLATADTHGLTPLHLAVINRNVEIARLLLEAGANASALDGQGNQPLHQAVMQGDLASATLLLQTGATTSQPNRLGFSVLGSAILLHNIVAVKLLIAHDADPSIGSANGSSPLHLAAYNNMTDAIEPLVTAGANPNARNVHGATPLTISLANGTTDAATELERLGATRSDAEAGLAAWKAASAALVMRNIEPHLSTLGLAPADIRAALKAVEAAQEADEGAEASPTSAATALVRNVFEELVRRGVRPEAAQKFVPGFVLAKSAPLHDATPVGAVIAALETSGALMETRSPLLVALGRTLAGGGGAATSTKFFERLADELSGVGMARASAVAEVDYFRARILARLIEVVGDEASRRIRTDQLDEC